MSKNNLLIEQISRFNFDQTVDKILKEAEKRAWNVPAIHNLQQSLAKSGRAVKPVKVIEICKPEYSGQMLELNHERIMSVMMPCRISVYVKDDGKTYTALVNGAELSAGQPENIAKVMKAASDETMEIVKTVTG
ncbi:MAG TPA: DUF302 domain-containing protein [Bacteroidales bacterium]|jgi:uncharacterized protein (DUF302 family)|nr:DUF302 domain-containing protein [Bacteroidales bacterium]OQB61470.1 MAG: hypothetical protein BWX96_01754 [Bacteroidetes bacterium ADurb.Bin145]NMD03980.1 DUF302 domain-containing protein [Bacteroidales bacterium]HOU02693.1 DUF302 domain-containing protein [Bacteroidales bacterium]HQG63783.1 DUF302 domain-containing protein [Bacteroidales bacterium]